MTRDDIHQMARQAWGMEFIPASDLAQLERFAALVAAAERETCAQLCDAEQPADPWQTVSAHRAGQIEMADHLAERIRARSQA